MPLHRLQPAARRARFLACLSVVLLAAAPASARRPAAAPDPELSGLMAHLRTRPVDRIPSIDRPAFTGPADAGRFLRPADAVVGLSRGGEKKAYPLALLDGREVVNDSLGGGPITVTW